MIRVGGCIPQVSPLSATEFEQYVAELLRGLSFLKKGTVTTNRRFQGVRQPGNYEVDVAVEVQLAAALKFRFIVECKNWRRPVDRPVIQKVAQTRDAIGADKAAVASPVGFTAEAEAVARALSIALWIITVREWIVVETTGHSYFSLALLKKDRTRDWIKVPANVAVLTWSNDPLFLHVIAHKDDLPSHLRWARFVPMWYGTYAIDAGTHVDAWAHQKLLQFDDELWAARVNGTTFREAEVPEWP